MDLKLEPWYIDALLLLREAFWYGDEVLEAVESRGRKQAAHCLFTSYFALFVCFFYYDAQLLTFNLMSELLF